MKPIQVAPLISPQKMSILKSKSTRFDEEEEEKILKNQGKFKTFLELRKDKKCKFGFLLKKMKLLPKSVNRNAKHAPNRRYQHQSNDSIPELIQQFNQFGRTLL